MVKHNDKTSRSTKKSNRKNTFNKYGKNTSRGLRIKQSDLEKKATKRKAEGCHRLVKFQMEHSKTKGKYSGQVSKQICKSTCRNKKHGSK
jgi:hypothetical protein